jgi:VanZ family protein
MLSLIKLESTDKLSGGHTIRLVGRILAWAGIHLRGSHLELLNLVLRKCGHMVGYGLLCFCWLLLLRGSYWLQHDYKRSLRGSIQIHRMWWRQEWAALATRKVRKTASADELHQMSIPSRTGSWWDVALDTGAGCVVLAMTWAKAQWLCRNRAA